MNKTARMMLLNGMSMKQHQPEERRYGYEPERSAYGGDRSEYGRGRSAYSGERYDYDRQTDRDGSRQHSYPHTMDERSATRWGEGDHDTIHKMQRDEGERYAARLRNADGSMGPHWTMEQTKGVMQSVCPDCDPHEFYLAINMMYSDYGDVMRKIGQDRPEVYGHLAKAFLYDEDAQPMKLERYMKYIAK